jgi:hypothetical protein
MAEPMAVDLWAIAALPREAVRDPLKRPDRERFEFLLSELYRVNGGGFRHVAESLLALGIEIGKR